MKGRASLHNPKNRFERNFLEENFFEIIQESESLKTKYILSKVKSIVNRVESPDLNFGYSMNPYQGCEHGCIYCYARPTHNYWGYSSGLDFESKIIVKTNAAEMLASKIKQRNWAAAPIALSGNTDCYQPAEKKFGLTRKILEVLLSYRHPVMIITKNSLILRDLDLLKKLNEYNLVSVVLSITTLDSKLQQKMEPRTSSPIKRLNTIKILSENNIPSYCGISPLIPGLTDHELFNIAEQASLNGAWDIHYSLVRLNHDLDQVFSKWLAKNYPAKYKKVLANIKSTRKGKLTAFVGENRMKGDGKLAKIIDDQYQFARKNFFRNPKKIKLNTGLHEKYKSNQLSLF